MTESEDIRWHQRLQNFELAFSELDEAVILSNTRDLSKLEEQGLIQAFEYTFELSWNTIKDFYQNQGETGIQGSCDAIRLAFKRELIEDDEKWLAMIKSRTLTSHTYNRETAPLFGGLFYSAPVPWGHISPIQILIFVLTHPKCNFMITY